VEFIERLIELMICCVISSLILVYAGIIKFIDPIFLGFILIALIAVYVFRRRRAHAYALDFKGVQ
jgi:hypothetical protein